MKKNKGLKFNILDPLLFLLKVVWTVGKGGLLFYINSIMFYLIGVFYAKSKKKVQKGVLEVSRETLIKQNRRLFSDFFVFLKKRNWFYFLINKQYRRQNIKLFLLHLLPDVLSDWFLEESWWLVFVHLERKFYKIYPFFFRRLRRGFKLAKKNQFSKYKLFLMLNKADGPNLEVFEKVGKSFVNTLRIKKSRDHVMYLSTLLKSLYEFPLFYNSLDEYHDEWANCQGDISRLYIVRNNASRFFVVLLLDYLEGRHFFSPTGLKYQNAFKFLRKGVHLVLFIFSWFLEGIFLYLMPGLSYCISGLPLVWEGLKDAFNDYYVLLFQEECFLLKTGCLYFWFFYLSKILGTDDFFELFSFSFWRKSFFVKPTSCVCTLLVLDTWYGIVYSILVFDALLVLLYSYLHLGNPPSFYKKFEERLALPLFYFSQDIYEEYYYFFHVNFFRAVYLYYLDYYLKGIMQIYRVDKKTVPENKYYALKRAEFASKKLF